MVFRREGGNAANVGQDELYDLLDSAFDMKLGSLDSRAGACLRELGSAKETYSRACDAFSDLEAEPDIENPYVNNASALKEQKKAYSTALKRILNGWSSDIGSGPNLYERYNAVLLKTERFIEETLMANSKFKQALYSYADYTSDLKKAFASIEKQKELLRGTLGRMGRELAEYNSVKERLDTLRAMTDELKMSSDTIESLSMAASGGTLEGAEEERLSRELSQSERDLEMLNAESSATHAEINRLLAPLERTARKFDHASGSKERLTDFMAEPVARMADESEYKKFRHMLSGLRAALDSGVIDTDNKNRLMEALDELMGSDIYGMISALRDLDVKRLELEGSIRLSRNALARLREGRESRRRAAETIESARAQEKETAAGLDETKRAIEKMFLDYYGKRIRIV
ncbi:hypothetical protein M1329_01135 [Candidatus Marsarchaeota archaeon]|nr:hypothetical protein [Candidatus Marsarchaeota archaeon]